MFKHKRTGRFVAQAWDADRGKNKQIGTYATQREAKRALAKAAGARPTSTMTVNQWREHWLATPQWKNSTRRHNLERTAGFAAVHGDKRLAKIDRVIARAWLKDHPSSFNALSAMFGAACYEDDEHGQALLPISPFSKLAKHKTVKRDLQADWLTEKDIVLLEQHALKAHGPDWGPTMAAMIRFAAETGIRPGELFVVERDDLRPDEGRMLVRRAAESRTRTVGTPKNGREREIVLSARAAEAALRAERFEGVDRVFSSPTGRQLWSSALSVAWSPVRKLAGRPDMAFYELRHWCATRLLEAGLSDADVAVQLGHTDGGELVRKVYGHPSQRRALDNIRRVLDEPDQEERAA